ncbi:MAG TPA: radical SAM protein, partial [Clostridia bacterium]|nr:radical SAM protein [Clostridia bacterium]
MDGFINSYESFATMEGPGIRFAVFMAGCNLRCAYCHNPDTWGGGQAIDSQSLYKTVLRYKPYFKNGGGVTFSGGEPLLQAEYILEVAQSLKSDGIHIALDTSCSLLEDSQKKLYNLCDLVIADLKFTTKENYNKYCKNDILGTVISTLSHLNENNIPVWIRIVIIPEINDTKEAISEYYSIVKDFTNIKKIELKPFHT